jgi:hypothetical protein
VSKTWAKIVVVQLSSGLWRIMLDSDISARYLFGRGCAAFWNRRGGALRCARAWSRRLGGIPVEVEEKPCT